MTKTLTAFTRCWLLMVVCILPGCGQKPHVVHISTDPSGAMVFLNDRIIGETPMDTTIIQRGGDYNVYTFRVVKEDYVPVRKMFKEQHYHTTVEDLIPTSLHFVLEERKKFLIHITSEPSGAVVTLNGEPLGETPFTTTVRERIGNPRIFEFVAVKEGYASGRRVVQEFLPQENGAVFVFPESIHFDLIDQPKTKQ